MQAAASIRRGKTPGVMNAFRLFVAAGAAVAIVAGAGGGESTGAGAQGAGGARVQLVVRFPAQQITGIAVSPGGRIFVNLPRWNADVPISVAEVLGGTMMPYPNAAWNAWRNRRPLTPGDHFVCVQSVVFDRQGHLWALDPGSPAMSGPVKGAPKLVEIDIDRNAVIKTIRFPEASAPPGSYLNDVRFSPDGHFAYMSDSGIKGALVVADLTSGESWRVLDSDPRTQFDKNVVPTADGHPLRRPDGRTLQAGADGIALSNDGATFYWQALDGKTLYGIPTATLRDQTASSNASGVRVVQTTHPADGLWIDPAGRFYVSNPEKNSVEIAARPGAPLTTLVADPRLRWPDSFAQGGPHGRLYVTTSHIQDSPWFKPLATTTPSEIWRIVPR